MRVDSLKYGNCRRLLRDGNHKAVHSNRIERSHNVRRVLQVRTEFCSIGLKCTERMYTRMSLIVHRDNDEHFSLVGDAG